MKVVFLTYAAQKPSTRFRVMQFLPHLEKAGHEVAAIALPKSPLRRYLRLLLLPRADVIVLQKRLLSPFFVNLLRSRCFRFIYDFDDAVMISDKTSPAARGALNERRKKRFETIVRKADCVVAGNSFLGEQAAFWGGRVAVVPSVPDLIVPLGESAARPAGKTVGWMGSAGNVKYLMEIKPVLDALGASEPGLRIRIVSDADLSAFREPWYERAVWSLETEADELRRFDIGLMPLSDTPWTRGKCGFKILQYMSASLPVVCSPVGVNRDFVRPGVNGFWAQNAEEWTTALKILLSTPDLRRKMGVAGRAILGREYAVERWAGVWDRLVRGEN